LYEFSLQVNEGFVKGYFVGKLNNIVREIDNMMQYVEQMDLINYKPIRQEKWLHFARAGSCVGIIEISPYPNHFYFFSG